MDMQKMAGIRVDDLEMRPDMFGVRLKRRALLRNSISEAMPVIDKAVEKYNQYTLRSGFGSSLFRQSPASL